MDQQTHSTPRRGFLKILFGGSVAALAAGFGLIVAKFLAPIAGEIVTVLAGRVAEFTDANASKLIKVGLKDVMLVLTGKNISAIDLKCTHAGCTVHWQPAEKNFLCPCHGGMYAADGKVLKGPPPRPLGKLRVAVTNTGDITVTDLPA